MPMHRKLHVKPFPSLLNKYFLTVISSTTKGAFSDFLLYPAQSNGRGTLSVAMDGVIIGEDGTSVLMKKDILVKKEVVIMRGPDAYQDMPVDITLQSKCE